MAREDNLPFGVWLEREIYRRGMTKSELAARLEVSPSVVTQWTSGETQPSYGRIDALAALLKVSCYELYLRLGHIQPRPELDIDWEVFISKVERDGLEFKRFVLNGLEDMRSAWLTRPRRAQAVMQVAARSLFDYSGAGYRAGDVWQGERLLYYGPIMFSDGSSVEIMVTVRQEPNEGYTMIAEFIGANPPEAGVIRVGEDVYRGQLAGSSMRFPAIQLDESTPPIFLVFEQARSEPD